MKKEVTLRVKESYAFDLETHGCGGYLWRVAANDESLLRVEIHPHKVSEDISDIPLGKSFPVRVELTALAVGECDVLLEEVKSWEKDANAMNRCSVKVTINT